MYNKIGSLDLVIRTSNGIPTASRPSGARFESLLERLPPLGWVRIGDGCDYYLLRNGGRLGANDQLHICATDLRLFNKFTYLGFVLTITSYSFGAHIEQRCHKVLMSF